MLYFVEMLSGVERHGLSVRFGLIYVFIIFPSLIEVNELGNEDIN